MLKRVLKALVWFFRTPKIWRQVLQKKWWLLACSCHATSKVSLSVAPEVGQGVFIGHRTRINGQPHGKLILEDRVWLGDDCEVGVAGTVRIAAGTSLQHRSQIHGDVDIGAGCVCAANVYIASTSHRFRDTPHLPIRWQDARGATFSPNTLSRPVVVEDDCWLGINVVVCPGVTVGRGTVIGANAVVTRDTPPYAVMAGVPARMVGRRMAFNPPQSLLATRSEDFPYFYAGFYPPGYGSDWGEATKNGLFVHQNFALAVQVQAGDSIRLDVWVTAPVRVRHSNQLVGVSSGGVLVFSSLEPNERGLFCFVVENWEPGCMSVRAVQVLGVGSVEG